MRYDLASRCYDGMNEIILALSCNLVKRTESVMPVIEPGLYHRNHVFITAITDV